jgi:hypothetical protein
MTIAIVAKAGAVLLIALSQAAAGSTPRVRDLFIGLKHRQKLRRLLEDEDHKLADIGINRDDLRAALSEPLWRDPTAALTRRMKDQGGHTESDRFPNVSKGERRKQYPRLAAKDPCHAMPTRPAVPPSMDIERYLAVLDRKHFLASPTAVAAIRASGMQIE